MFFKDEKKAATQKTVTVRENLKVEVEVKDLSDLSKERLTQAKKRFKTLLAQTFMHILSN